MVLVIVESFGRSRSSRAGSSSDSTDVGDHNGYSSAVDDERGATCHKNNNSRNYYKH